MRKLARWVTVLLCPIFLFLIVGCSSKSAQPPAAPVLTFQAKTEITYGKNNYQCNLNYSPEQGAELKLLLPKELEGMEYSWDRKILSVRYEGLEVSQENLLLPENSVITLLLTSLDASSEALTTSGDGLYFGSVGAYHFTLSADKRTGQITQLDIPEEGFSATFIPTADEG